MNRQNSEVSGLSADGVGGIGSTRVTLTEGVTVLPGRNATNRTSFLRAVMAAMGSDDASLRGDRDEGAVELEVDGERYSRTLARRDGETVLGGDRIAALVDYFSEHPDYLVVALLPEDAAALDEDYSRVTEI